MLASGRYTNGTVKRNLNRISTLILLVALAAGTVPAASAQNAKPALVVVIVVDQLRAEALDRNHDRFGATGLRNFMDKGAYFAACNYDYATTFTAPGHASLFTGTYAMNHGINSNDWWDAAAKKRVSSVDDPATTLVGVAGSAGTPAIGGGGPSTSGASPHNLMTDTLGDELKLATGGRSRVFAISLKDRSAILPGGFASNGSYWIDPRTGAFETSSFYMKELPKWVAEFDASRPAKYWDREWKDASGKVLSTTSHMTPDGKPANFYDAVGRTPFANDHEFDFAREMITQEKLGQGPATDLLAISLSANDILGHRVGPDAPEAAAMVLALDRQIGEFMTFLGQQIGLAKVWIVISSDHGVSPVPSVTKAMRIPSRVDNYNDLKSKLSAAIAKKLGTTRTDYIRWMEWPLVFVNDEAFAGVSEADAESDVAVALRQVAGARRTFTKSELASGNDRNDPIARRFEHSYSPVGSWYVLAQVPPFTLDTGIATTHGSPYNYDTHVPLGFYGLAFRPGVYRQHCEPIDMAPTIASALDINPPAAATGRVLTEALASHPGAEKE
jgi:predicted AlkP superfamily pyrophosphatase or phosphodiesterase